MDKYYLSRVPLADNCDNLIDSIRESDSLKLIELQYERRPPTLGVVQLRNGRCVNKQQLVVTSLELDNHQAKLADSQTIGLGQPNAIVSFDVAESIHMDPPANKPNEILTCITLNDFGQLTAVQLNDGSTKGLTSGCDPKLTNQMQFVQCKLVSQLDTQDSSIQQVHVLADRCYFVYSVLAAGKLQLLHKHSLAGDHLLSSKRFVEAFIVNHQVTIIKSNDSSLRILQKSACLSTDFRPIEIPTEKQQQQQHLILNNNEQGTIILSSSGTRIVAHNLIVEDSERQTIDDPDNLLPREPSFELDECWSMDLGEIDSLRALDQEDVSSSSLLCPFWSPMKPSGWPQFLFIAHKHHILVYSLEQQSVLPFSVTYDQSFINIPPSNDGPLGGSSELDIVDLRLKPKLVHNFKLIGAQPTDTLFNNLFLSLNVRLVQMRQFLSLGLLIGSSQYGHLFAFKTTSSKISSVKDNRYQQLVADSLRDSLVLREELSRIQAANDKLGEQIAKLSQESNQSAGSRVDMDSLLQVNLDRRHDVGGLYHLRVSISNLVQVRRIIVVSTVSCHLLEPIGSISDASIHNDVKVGSPSHLLARADPSFCVDESLDEKIDNEDVVQAFIEIHLDYPSGLNETVIIPMFLMDGQAGQVKIFYVLSEVDVLQPFGATLASTEPEQTAVRFHECQLDIKPLTSYKLIRAINTADRHMILEIRGKFTSAQAFNWLNQLVDLQDMADKLSLESSFNHCSIHLTIGDNFLDASSDDLFALESIKRVVLREATNESIKLDINHPNPSAINLRRLIAKQYQNLIGLQRSEQLNSGEDLDLLMVDLLGNFDGCELSQSQSVDFEQLKGQMRNDIEKSAEKNRQTQLVDRDLDSISHVSSEIVGGFIIDALVDFDRLQETRTSSLEAMSEMKLRFDRIFCSIKSLNANAFADELLNAWQDIKKAS